MTQRAANERWANAFATQLDEGGLDHVTLAPGSRSTPLVLAFARQTDVDLHVHVDERSAAFHALGLGKATGKPAGVLTTSGTATANLHPGTIEARYSSTPLVLLTSDRPPKLQGTDANQTIDQTKLYGDHVLAFHDLGPPNQDPDALRHVQAQARRILSEATGTPSGPVHVNLPFPKPLEPSPETAKTPRPPSPSRTGPRVHHPSPRAQQETLSTLASQLDEAQRPLLVAGPTSPFSPLGQAAIQLAETTNAPLLADPLSGARFTASATGHALSGYDLFLQNEETATDLTPDLVLRLGGTPTSKTLTQHLARTREIPHIVVDDDYPWKDASDTASIYLNTDPADTASRLASHVTEKAKKPWRHAWHQTEAETRRIVRDETHQDPFEANVLAKTPRILPEQSLLVVGNSMPVRDLDAYAPPQDSPLTVLGNRGASGIDGLVSTTIGASQATDQATVAVLGDLTFLHDANGLHGLEAPEHPLVFVVINNDGGGIFHKLPIHEHDEFTDYFATPHGRDLSHLANLHGIHHERVEPGSFPGRLEACLRSDTVSLLEVSSDREENAQRHETVIQRIREPTTTR